MQSTSSLDSWSHSDPVSAIGPAKGRRRLDIQALRGVAVLMVVAYHALPDVVKGGFLGVDVFFVISGFLITGHILQDLERERFRLGGFYLRRARRLLPAAWTTFFITTLLAYPLLTSEQWRDYLEQLLGSLTFTANFALAHQSGYFEAAADAKPLLHIWSLSLEEQFYFVVPIVLLVLGRRLRAPALFIGAIISLGLCIALVSGWLPFLAGKAGAKFAFYMLPARAWELLVGGLAAWLMMRRPHASPPALLKWAALAVVLALSVRTFELAHPRADAMLVVAATAIMLLGGDGWIRGLRSARPVVSIGDWSYSIYLIHWPLLAFAHAAWIGSPPDTLAVAIAAASVPLGWVQYRWIEQPFQKRLVRTSRGAAVWAGGALAAFVAACAPAAWARYSTNAVTGLEPTAGLGAACDQHSGVYRGLPDCRTSATPTIAVWGDSYAMHLVPGFLAAGTPLVQITKSTCAPALGVAALHGNYNAAWGRECTAFTESALKTIEGSPTIRTVVISSPFSQIVNPDAQLFIDGEARPWRPVGAQRIADLVRRVQATGKRVVIVGPTPSAGFDAGECNERLNERLPIFGRKDCSIELADSRRQQRYVVAALAEVRRQTGVEVLWPEMALCEQGRCATATHGVFLYRDKGHLTKIGSVLVARRLRLNEIALAPG